MNEGTSKRTDDVVARAYDVVARSYAELVPTAGREGDPETDVELSMVREFATSLPLGASVLDAGCGAGRMITYFDTLAALTIDGCDVSKEMVQLARRAHPQRRIAVAALSSLPYAERSFDGVLAWYSIIHTPPSGLADVFAEFRRILRPGGMLLLGFQAGTGARRISEAYGHEVDLLAYLHDVSDVAAQLEGSGFHIRAGLSRAATGQEPHAQGFVSARCLG